MIALLQCTTAYCLCLYCLCTPACACRLASGDRDGGVVIWDVMNAAVLHRLEDVPNARDLARRGNGVAVQCLAWVLPRSGVLAVVLAPAQLLLWDVHGMCMVCVCCVLCTTLSDPDLNKCRMHHVTSANGELGTAAAADKQATPLQQSICLRPVVQTVYSHSTSLDMCTSQLVWCCGSAT